MLCYMEQKCLPNSTAGKSFRSGTKQISPEAAEYPHNPIVRTTDSSPSDNRPPSANRPSSGTVHTPYAPVTGPTGN